MAASSPWAVGVSAATASRSRAVAGDLAITEEDAYEFGLLAVGLVPVGIGPFFLDPFRLDRIGRKDEKDNVGIETLTDLEDDVFAITDLALVEPDLDLASGLQGVGEVADEGFVLARM